MSCIILDDKMSITTTTTKNNNNNNKDCQAIIPRLIDFFDDGHGDVGPLVMIGYYKGTPVYRTTNTLALGKSIFDTLYSMYWFSFRILPSFIDWEGSSVGDLEVHWPALFPDTIIPLCGPLQLDVTIRLSVRINRIDMFKKKQR